MISGISERQASVLEAAISEYISGGEPVASDVLREHFRFPYSPATIRSELLRLTEAGYLDQPHTSAGRMPTDMGYRWYADRLIESKKIGKRERDIANELLESWEEDMDAFFRLSTGFAAELVHAFAIAGSVEEEVMHKSGFRELLSNPEFRDQELRDSLGELMDTIDVEIKRLASKNNGEPRVFVGDESPIGDAKFYSLAIKTVARGGRTGVIAILGAKRMRYDKAVSFLSALDEIIDP